MKKYFKDYSYYCVAYNDFNEPLSYRTIIYSFETAWEIGATNNLEGRNIKASFTILIE
jgi:hypothetical protein